MRHRISGRTLGRNASHRHAMFRNMAASLIKTVRVVEDDEVEGRPKVAGRIVTTVAKAKELRPYVERLVTMARKALAADAKAVRLATTADRKTPEWKEWRNSVKWREWNQAKAPGVALRRRAFALLRDKEAVDILFSDLAVRFESRPGGYTRILRIADRRLGDSGPQALIEFVGRNDRTKRAPKQQRAPLASTPRIQQAAAEQSTPAASSDAPPAADASASAE